MIKKSFYDFWIQVMTVFAFVVFVLNVFCLVLGAAAKDYSSIFALSDQGIPASVVFQFFAASVLIVGIKYFFESDVIIRKVSYPIRILCMLSLIFVVAIAFSAAFYWFPLNQVRSWILLIVCYSVSFFGSFLVSSLRMKQENKRLSEALEQLKKQQTQ